MPPGDRLSFLLGEDAEVGGGALALSFFDFFFRVEVERRGGGGAKNSGSQRSVLCSSLLCSARSLALLCSALLCSLSRLASWAAPFFSL